MSRTRVDFRVTGASDVFKNFNVWETKKRMALKKVVKKFSRKIGKDMRSRVPVRTGRLKKSIKVKQIRDGLSAEVSAFNPHAHLVEFGTVNMPAQPFMTPAFESNSPAYMDELRRALT